MTEAERKSKILAAMFPNGNADEWMADPRGDRDVIRGTLDETFGYMFRDIEREIELAERGEGGGNYLAALGLLCYSEYMGSWITGTFGGRGQSGKNFREFSRLMGEPYATLLEDNPAIYDVFRNGMAHRYSPKESCDIHMLGSDLIPPPTAGIIKTGQEWPTYRFIVRNYHADFKRLCFDLGDLLASFPRMPQDAG